MRADQYMCTYNWTKNDVRTRARAAAAASVYHYARFREMPACLCRRRPVTFHMRLRLLRFKNVHWRVVPDVPSRRCAHLCFIDGCDVHHRSKRPPDIPGCGRYTCNDETRPPTSAIFARTAKPRPSDACAIAVAGSCHCVQADVIVMKRSDASMCFVAVTS